MKCHILFSEKNKKNISKCRLLKILPRVLSVKRHLLLTLKAPSKRHSNFVCSKRHSNFFFFYFSEKTSLDISCESSAWQMIHLKCQDLFSLKNKRKKLLSAAVVIGAL